MAGSFLLKFASLIVLCIESFESSPDENAYTHWVSIDVLTRKKRRYCKQYTGRIRSSGLWEDERNYGLVTAIFQRNANISSKRWARLQVEIAETVKKALTSFNNSYIKGQLFRGRSQSVRFARHHYENNRRFSLDCSAYECIENMVNTDSPCKAINIQIPQIARVESASAFGGGRVEYEHFIFTDKLSHPRTFISADRQNIMESYRRSVTFRRVIMRIFSQDAYMHDDQNIRNEFLEHELYQREEEVEECSSSFPNSGDHRTLRAFEHYFLYFYNGSMAVDCLMGTYDEEEGYKLTQPVIHSLDQRFGPTDRGNKGILDVLNKHHCSSLCRHLPRFD